MSGSLDRMIELLLKFRILVATIVITISVVASMGAAKLGFASDYRVFFGEGNPELAEWDDFQATFARNDNVLFVLQNADGSEFDVNLATVVEDLTERAWLLPNATRVDSLSNFQRTKATADDLEVADLYEDAVSLSEADINERLDYAMGEPALYKALIAGDAKTTGVNVTIEVQGDPNQAVSDVALAAYGVADALRAKYPGLTVAMNGSMIMNYGFIESGMRDGMTLIPAMYAAMLLLTLIMLRSFSAMIATLITIVLSTTVALGIAGHLGMQMAPITIIAPNIILTLAIADCIHIISSVQKGLRAGLSKNDAIKESLRKNFTAVFVTSATTAVGFLCLNFSDAPPFQYLGNITAFGVLAAWILAITVVPVFLSFMPLKPAAKARESRLDGVLQRLANSVIANSRAVLIVGGIASVTIAGLALTNDLDDRFTRYFGKSLQVRQDLDFAAENLRGQDNFEYEIKAPEGESISNPDYLKTLDAFTLWLRDQPEVDQVTSLSDTIKRLNQNMNGDDRDFYEIPASQEAAAQYLLLYELSLPFGLDLNNQINIDKSATRLSVVITDIKISKQDAFHQRVADWATENAPTGMIPSPTGTSVIFASLTMRNLSDMITGNIVAVVAIALMMMVTLRSVSIGFISVVTNAIPALVTFGFWALTVGHIGMAVAVIGAASLGIVVDDSVHFLTKYLRGLREKNLSREDAIRYAFAEVGEAIVFTSVIVGIGFGIIAMSTFQVNAQLGLLTAITVVVAMVFDFIMLPAILLLGHKSPETTLTNGVRDVEFT